MSMIIINLIKRLQRSSAIAIGVAATKNPVLRLADCLVLSIVYYWPLSTIGFYLHLTYMFMFKMYKSLKRGND